MNADQIIDLNLNPESEVTEVETVGSLKFLFLFILSLGLYGIWWMYITWRFFKEKDSEDIMPVWRAIFSIFFVYGLFNRISDLAKQNNSAISTYSSGLLTAAYIILNFVSRLPDPWWMLSFLSGLCFLQPINAFNSALDSSDKYRAKDAGVTAGQVLIIVLGCLLWVLILAGLFLPEEPVY